MAFRRKGGGPSGAEIRTTALVVAVDRPIDNASRLSNVGRGTVRILLDIDSKPIYVARRFLLDEDHWLARGMQIPIAIDPAQPDQFEIEWASIPSIEARVAANDVTLADPRQAAVTVADAMRSAGLMGPDVDALPTEIREQLSGTLDAQRASRPDRFGEALDRAASEPAPAGRSRAVAVIATAMVSLHSDADGGGPSRVDSSGTHRAVLAINVPGHAPYAVFVRKFKQPRGRGDVAGAGLPALVSATDPNDVEILWDDMPSVENQLGQRIADRMHEAEAGMQQTAAMEQQMMEAVQRASAAPPGPAGPNAAPVAAAMGQMPPEMKAMMAQNAKLALQVVKDPDQRRMLIEQYRIAGIPIDDDAGS